ncbi:hypothetical protein WMY93_027590 [Mugilogobius chulae]|uniref:KIAA2013 n=1 Tax=Mugilogobius chulae TaxID=88201 RepID=A0AAW0MXQ9_9GOBI
MWLQQRLKGLPGLLSSSWARRLLVGLLLFLIFYWYLGGERGWPLLGSGAVPGGPRDSVCWRRSTGGSPWWSGERGKWSHAPGPRLQQAVGVCVLSGRLGSGAPDPVLAQSGGACGGSESGGQSQLLWFRKGAVLSVRCISSSPGDCVTVREEFMAHRSMPNVYVQRIHINNPTERPASVELSYPTSGGHFSTSVEKLEEMRCCCPQDESSWRRTAWYLWWWSPGRSTLESQYLRAHRASKLEETFSALREAAKKELLEILRLSVDELVLLHQQAWMDLFISGVEMRRITDSHTPSSRTVNSTLYYILSASSAPLLDHRLASDERSRLESSLNYADHCFSGHATMHAENLWPDRLSSAAHILQLVTLWTLTLQKRGCKVLVAAGAHGVMQGMVLSFGGLQFTENHLQFQADPDVLHNSYALRGIHYNQDLLNLAVLLDVEGKPFLHVSVKPQEKPVKLYACEAGCMNEPVELTSEVKGHTFPVMVTQPITPLLYISTDLRHLQDLRHTLHLKAILAHEEHMANRYPGLPFLFWFSVASLITLFHLFLFKLIYNEYCGPGAKPLFRSKGSSRSEEVRMTA